ncbi:Fusaric acid resistance protein-like-domain-containing protein [Crassisporium funariophilum]|nr:Fusaric acid resistance protein-like-domain-containing protein [Crassisporium funariophilum]
MENEGHLHTNIDSTARTPLQRLDSDQSSREQNGAITGLSPRIRHTNSFQSQQSESNDGTFPRIPSLPEGPTSHVYTSEDWASSSTSIEVPTTASRTWYTRNILPFRLPHLSTTNRNVLKCAIAYFIASLFTFSPFLSRFISDMTSYGPGNSKPHPSGHMVATIAVYFNPAKTVGSMIEADLFCIFGLLYSATVCLVTMSMFWWLELKPGWEWMGDLVAIVWIGLSMSGLAWMKVWMAIKFFIHLRIACSMTAIIIFVVLVKEGGLETLFQVSTIVIIGAAISNIVCYLIWPQTAISNLQCSMTTTLESFSTLLPMITRIFLLENGSDSHSADMEKIQRAIENHQNSFTSLQKNLREAKTEWSLMRGITEGRHEFGTARTNSDITGRRSYEDAVDCLNRLAQHLNGLRSGTRLQHDFTKAGVKHSSRDTGKGKSVESDANQGTEDEATLLRAAAAIFGDLVDELGPPLKALSSASTFTLNRLMDVCMYSGNPKPSALNQMQPHEFSELVEGIEAALVRFESTSNHAVLRLYRRSDPSNPRPTSPTHSETGPAFGQTNKFLTESDNEHVFLVYFFIFTLQEFAKELISLVDAIERIYYYEQQILHLEPWWIRFATQVQLAVGNLSAYIIPRHRLVHPSFPKIRPHAPDTIQTPPRHKLTFLGRIKHTLWMIGKRLKERDTKYAIKAGMATSILAFPAFMDSTRPTFVAYWGDWALISFFVVISPTIGATNYLSLQRFLGTLFGAAVAVGLYSIFPEDAIVLAISGFIFCIPCFYFAVARPQYLSASRFVLLTYNLTCLYCYNLRQRDVAVIDIGFHRALAVMAGILWAALVSRFWWPAEARRELSKALSEFCLNIGWLYTRLVASNSFAPEYRQENLDTSEDSPESTSDIARPTRLSNSIHEFMEMELYLQIKLIELQNLLAQAQHEPRLKGPFPVELYRGILISLQTILDKLHSMRCVTTREEWYTSARQDFIIPVNKERREMVGNIMLSFSTLASSFRLKAPLPPYLPPAEKARLRLVEAIRKLDVVKNRDVKGSRQLLFFAYALAMKGVTMELEFLGRTLQDAFGVIGQTSEEFEMLFLPLGESQGNIDYVA